MAVAPGLMWFVCVSVVNAFPLRRLFLVTPLLFSVVRPVCSSLSAILSSMALLPAGVLRRGVARGDFTLRRFFAALAGGSSLIGPVTSCARWVAGLMWFDCVSVVERLSLAAFVLLTPLLFSVARPASSSLTPISASTALLPAGVLRRGLARLWCFRLQ